MLFDGIRLVEGSEIQNLVVDSGTEFPASPDQGELFFRSDEANKGLYIYQDSQWLRQVNNQDSVAGLLPSTGVTPGTYKSVTVDTTGRILSGSNPSTLVGYGIIDAQPLDGDLTSIAALAGTSGILRKIAANTWSLDTAVYLTGNQNIVLSGDVSGNGSTTISVTLGNVNSNVGSFGTSTYVPSFTVNAKGLITAASSAQIPNVVASGASGFMTGADKTKLDSISSGANAYVLPVASASVLGGVKQGTRITIAGDGTISATSTDLAQGANTATQVVITSSTGTSATLNAATTTLAGVLTAADKTKIDSLTSGANGTVTGVTASAPLTASVGAVPNISMSAATGSTSGYLSSSDWTVFNTKQAALGFTPENVANKNIINGYAGLDASGKILSAQLPALAITDTFVVASESAMLALSSAETGDVAVRTDINKSFILKATGYSSLANWQELLTPTDSVASVNGLTGTVVLTAANITGFASVATLGTFASLTSKPTTLAGYGITDAQASDADLTAIAALAGTTGFLKKTAANTWTLDTATYLTGNQSISVTGDITGTGTTAITTTLSNTGITAGTYTKVTVDAKGRATTGAQLASSDVTAALGFTPNNVTTTAVINPGTPKNGDIQISGSVISIYNGGWKQIFPAVYS